MASSSSRSTSPTLSKPPEIDVGGTPTVILDAVDIDHAMAARLTIALLGHMLYMKGQVPFPVPSIARMTQREAVEATVKSRTVARKARKRAEFLQSYDDLTSHLHTTFVAVSTALALNNARHHLIPIPASSSPTRLPAKVHVLLMLGSSPSLAKTRLLLELDGLRVEGFGEQEMLRREQSEGGAGGGNDNSTSDCSDEDSEERSSADETDAGDTHAPSLPSHTPDSLSPMLKRTTITPPSPSHGPFHSPASSSRSSCAESPPPSSSSVDSDSDTEESTDSQTQHALGLGSALREEEAAIRAGERLLSRALFAAGEALEFGDEISPTQAHIFIRAPRRLAHPTWVPRESLGNTLDRHVRRFLHPVRAGGLLGMGAFGTGVRTVGVRVTCRYAKGSPHVVVDNREKNTGGRDSDEHVEGDDERDELIWWSWDGKLVGFAD